MTPTHGTKARFYYHTFDMSGHAEQVSVQLTRAFPEYRPLNATAVRRPAGGALDGSIALTGGALDMSAGANSEYVWNQLKSDAPAAWAFMPGGDVLGRLALLGLSLGQNQQRTAGDDIVRLPVALVTTEQVDVGVVLRALGAGGISPGASQDGTASTPDGGAGYLLCTANSGTLDVTIEHSVDGIANWEALATFTQLTAGAEGSEVVAVSGTVRRYLRATWTIGGTATFFVGFARR